MSLSAENAKSQFIIPSQLGLIYGLAVTNAELDRQNSLISLMRG
jgi:hypothetical protein